MSWFSSLLGGASKLLPTLGGIASIIPGGQAIGAGLNALGGLTGALGGISGSAQNEAKMMGMGQETAGYGRNMIGQGQSMMNQFSPMFGQAAQGLSQFINPSYMNDSNLNPYLNQGPQFQAMMEGIDKDYGSYAGGLAGRFGGGVAGSSGLSSQLGNTGMRAAGARAGARRDLLIQGNNEAWRRTVAADNERFNRQGQYAQLAGQGTQMGQGLVGQGIGHLGGLQGLYADQQKGYGAGLAQLGKLGGGVDWNAIGGMFRRGQGGGTTKPGTTTNQAASSPMQWY